MALYQCFVGGGINPDSISVVKKWTATGWYSDVPKTGSQSFTMENKGLYILTAGGNISHITCDTFIALGANDKPIPINHTDDTNAHATAFYKVCDAGEEHTFDWSVGTWNRTGGLEVTLLFIPL